jgi:hypothetical protein
MRIVIPSFGRAPILRAKTLTMLEMQGFQRNEIDIWVSNPEQLELYKKEIPDGNFFVSNTSGLVAKRNAITAHYEPGAELVCLDDDVGSVAALRPDFSLREFIHEAFAMCRIHNTPMWGVYPCGNTFFMKERWRVGFTFLVGAMWGIRNVRSVHVEHSSCEDAERVVQVFKSHGRVLRYEGCGPVTKYFAAGGINLSESRTLESEKADKALLYEAHRDLFSKFAPKKNGHWELTYRRQLSYILDPSESDGPHDDFPELREE